MEELAYLFNSDFEKRLFDNNFQTYTSTKTTQEFEYFIGYLNPDDFIFSTKKYTESFRKSFIGIAGKDINVTSKASKIIPWCNDYSQVEAIKKFQDKLETLKFLKNEKLITHHAKIIKDHESLNEIYIYKDPYSFSGLGHYRFPLHRTQIEKTLANSLEIIEEELLDRTLDFSHLIIDNKVVATYENYVDDYFQYKGTYLSSHFTLPGKLNIQMQKALSCILSYTKSYPGEMSLDAFLYKKNNQIYLHPCCEINARKTMGYFAFNFKEKYFKDYCEFKLLLQRNTKSIKDYSYFENKNVKLLSPLENRFYVFALAANDTNEMKEIELDLFTTFF